MIWEVSGVIDVENTIAADPLIDLAKTDYHSLSRGEPERSALFEGYGSLPPTPSSGSNSTGSTTRSSCGTGSVRSARSGPWVV